MAGKTKHWLERGDAFYARMAVPAKLRGIIGKSELLEHLGTNRSQAKRLHAAAVARMIDQLTDAERQLDARERPASSAVVRAFPLDRSEAAMMHYSSELELDEAMRNSVFADGTPALTAVEQDSRQAYLKLLRLVKSGGATPKQTEAAIGWAIDLAEQRGLKLPRREIARLLATAQIEVVEAKTARDAGMPDPEPRHPHLQQSAIPERTYRLPLGDLYDEHMQQLQRSGRGRAAALRWKNVIPHLKGFLGHDDARRVTRADMSRWRDELLKSLDPRTVKNTYLAVARAIFASAVDSGRLISNPAAGLRVRVGKEQRARERGFNAEEAVQILRAAQNYESGVREHAKTAAAKRWTPWLAAYTGARIAELTQLRKQDVREEDGIVYLRITPEAGSTKTGLYRDVPLHPHLIELGFVDFVHSSTVGPMFYSSSGSGERHPAKAVADRVGKWVRSLSLIDMAVSPNHGWRHRFKTVFRELDASDRVVDAIQGHASRTAGDDYGDVTLKAKDRVLRLHPRYKIG